MKVQLNLIRKAAWSFYNTTGKDYEDLFSEASAAYCEALNTFDQSKGTKFTTYTWNCMRNALINYVKENREVPVDDFSGITPSYEHQPFFELFEQFSEDAQEVISRIIEYPHDYLEQPPKMARGQLVRELIEEGNSHKKAWDIIREIKQVVNNTE